MSVSGSENLVSIKSLGFGLETFAKFLEGLGFGSKKFGIRKKSRFRFQKIWSQKKVSVSVLENLVSGLLSEHLISEDKSRFRFWKIWPWKKSLCGIDSPRDRLRHLSGCQGEDSSKEQSIKFVCSCGISRS